MFQERLYQLRRERGLSQEDLANEVGVSRQAVQKWESGTSQPTLENLTALARYFGVTLDWLIIGEEHVPTPTNAPTVINHYHYERKGWSFEYKSKRTLWGLPLVHVKVQSDRLCWARGIIAVGNIATGLVSVGGFSAGLLTLGGICAGLAAIGGIAAGLLAWGGLAFGLVTIGGVSMGQFAYGGVAMGSRLAIGRAASAPVAIGDAIEAVNGREVFVRGSADPSVIAIAVRDACEGMPRWFAELMVRLAGG